MFRCPNDPWHDEFIVFPGSEEEDPDGLGVIVYADGAVSNRRGDGVVSGYPRSLYELAEDETTAVCAYCHDGETIEWTRDATTHTPDEARVQPPDALECCSLDHGSPCPTCIAEAARRAERHP